MEAELCKKCGKDEVVDEGLCDECWSDEHEVWVIYGEDNN